MPRPVPILPGRGLDLSYVDDRQLVGPPCALRGAANVRLVDAEWWTREGEIAKRYGVADCAASHAVTVEVQVVSTPGGTPLQQQLHFLISQWGVVQVYLPTWQLEVPYAPSWVGSMTMTNGSADGVITVTNSGDADNAALFGGKDSDGVNTVYRKVAKVGATVTLHRPWPYTSGSYVMSGYVALGDPSAESRADNDNVSWCVFRQLYDHAQGALWSTGAATAPWYLEKNPLVAAGGLYLIVCTGQPSSGGTTGPYAIRIDTGAKETLLGEFMRKTKTGSPTAFNSLDTPRVCSSWQGRLFVSRADTDNANNDRTVWYSEDGDLLKWHSGNVGYDASHNSVRLDQAPGPISAIAPLGENLIIHRRRGVARFEPIDSAVTPFLVREVTNGIGCIAQHSLLATPAGHFFWSDYGPMRFDGVTVEPLPDGVSRLARLFRSTSEWIAETAASHYPRSIAAAYHAARQEIWWTLNGVGDYWESSYADGDYGSQVLVYNLRTQEAMRFTYKTGFSLGVFRDDVSGKEFVVRTRPGGDVCQATQTNRAKDSSLTQGNAGDEPFAYGETPWMDLGHPRQKEILRAEFVFRVFPSASDFVEDFITDEVIGTSGTFKYQLDIHTDFNVARTLTEDKDTYRVEVSQADLDAIGATSEGARLVPTILVRKQVRLRGRFFKLRFRNYGDLTPNSRPFRLSQVVLYVEDGQSDKPEAT